MTAAGSLDRPSHSPCNSTALTVTFDTNTLAPVVCPATAQLPENKINGAAVRAAIQAGRICGFFSETIITVEGIKGTERWDVLSKTRVFSDATSIGENGRGPSVSLRFGVGMHHVRSPLDRRASARIQAALELGIRPLWTASRFGHYHLDPEAYPVFKFAVGMPDFLRCMDDVNAMATEIERRGLGRRVAAELGQQFSKRDGVDTPELWLQGLGRACNESERAKVAAATREWADGDIIAAHYGFGIQLFCSDDFGKSSPGPSVLDYGNRKWLSEEFGIEFVTLAELAQRVTE